MELPSKLLEQISFNIRSKKEEHMLIVMDKSTHEEHLFQPRQTNNKQFKIEIIFLTGYNGIFNITKKNNKFYFKNSIIEEDFIQARIPKGVYEIESLNKEIKRILTEKEYFTDANYPITIRPNFSTPGSIVEIKPEGDAVIGFIFDDNIGSLLRFNETIFYKEYNLSPNPVDIITFDNIFNETDITQGKFFTGRRSGIIHNFTMNVSLGYKFIERFLDGMTWFMLHNKDIISSINFKLENENGNLVSFDSQSITFRLSIKEIRKFYIINTKNIN